MMMVIWGVAALAVGLLASWIAARRALPPGPPLAEGVELPATPLQRVSRWSVVSGLLISAGAAGVVIAHGPGTTYANDRVRLVFTLLVLAAIAVLGGSVIWVKRRAVSGSFMDERDRAILDRAPAVQGVAMIVTLAVWMIGLIEAFHAAGAVPLSYLYLVFWSCLLVHLLGLHVGVLAGYRRP